MHPPHTERFNWFDLSFRFGIFGLYTSLQRKARQIHKECRVLGLTIIQCNTCLNVIIKSIAPALSPILQHYHKNSI